MGEKKGKKDGGEKDKSEEQKGITVVLKTEMHCEGCATKILKCAKNIEGVEKAKAEWEANKLTVKGEVDPSELREELQERLNKKVELISPQLPKKDKAAGGDKGGGDSKKSTDDKSKNKKDDNNNKNSSKDVKKSDDKKPKEKEAPVTTAVLKLRLHCGGCIDKIHKIASKTKGVESIKVDREKELVTVTGTMDAKALAESLEEKMKRSVQIVPPKKDKDGGGSGEGKDNDGGGGGGNKKDKKKGGGGDARDEAETGSGGMVGGNRMEYVGLPMPNYGSSSMYGPAAGFGPGYGYPQPYPYPNPYTYPYGNNLHAPQIFSDENPNACSVM